MKTLLRSHKISSKQAYVLYYNSLKFLAPKIAQILGKTRSVISQDNYKLRKLGLLDSNNSPTLPAQEIINEVKKEIQSEKINQPKKEAEIPAIFGSQKLQNLVDWYAKNEAKMVVIRLETIHCLDLKQKLESQIQELTQSILNPPDPKSSGGGANLTNPIN